MKALLLLILLLSLSNQNDKLSGTVWNRKVAKGCINTLTFLPNGNIAEYDCEMDYKFSGTYKVQDDIVYINEIDDSHSEDGGKITNYKETLIIKKDGLYVLDTIKGRIKSHIVWYKKTK